MPLVTRSAVQSNVYRQATAPTVAQDGDVWVDTDTGAMYTSDGTNWIQQTAGALGTANKVLAVNSGATALEFAANVFSNAGSGTATGSGATFTTTLTAYDIVVLYVRIVGDTANTSIALRLNGDSGTKYNGRSNTDGTFAAVSAASSFSLTAAVVGQVPYWAGQIILINRFNSNGQIFIRTDAIKGYGTTPYTNAIADIVGNYTASADITSISFIVSSGNVVNASKVIALGRNL